MIDLVLGKKDMLCYVQDLRAVREMARGLLYHHVLCKVRLEGTRIKRREVVNGTRSLRSDKLREHQ